MTSILVTFPLDLQWEGVNQAYNVCGERPILFFLHCMFDAQVANNMWVGRETVWWWQCVWGKSNNIPQAAWSSSWSRGHLIVQGKMYPKFLLDLVSKVGGDEQANQKLAEKIEWRGYEIDNSTILQNTSLLVNLKKTRQNKTHKNTKVWSQEYACLISN